jgi:phage shock protein E
MHVIIIFMKSIDAQDLKNKIDKKENIVIIDVRTPQELSRGKIAGSINIPLDSFENEIDSHVTDKNENIYLYCLSGSRSIMASQIMDRKGYQNVFNLTSGLLAWRNKNYPLVAD